MHFPKVTFFTATRTYRKLLVRLGAGEIDKSQRKTDRPYGPCQSASFPLDQGGTLGSGPKL